MIVSGRKRSQLNDHKPPEMIETGRECSQTVAYGHKRSQMF